jgi:hypothetical protein
MILWRWERVRTWKQGGHDWIEAVRIPTILGMFLGFGYRSRIFCELQSHGRRMWFSSDVGLPVSSDWSTWLDGQWNAASMQAKMDESLNQPEKER